MVRGGLSSRRGMSPLIATVLLMAFAVALGGMIMNWSIDISANSECEAISMRVTQFCSQEGSILLGLQSQSSSTPLAGLQLNVLSGNIEHVLNIKNSELQPGERSSLSIPFAGAQGSKVTLLGVVGSENAQVVCEERPIEIVDPIEPC